MAYEGSQARGPMRTTTAYPTTTTMPDWSRICNLHTPQLMAMRILNPLSAARDQTHILTNAMSGS